MVAYRLWDSDRNVFSGLSPGAEVELDGGTTDQYITTSVSIATASTNIGDFDKAEVYRTIPIEVASNQYEGGLWFYVGTVSLTTGGGNRGFSYGVGGTNAGEDGLRDRQVVLRRVIDPNLQEAGTPPRSGNIATYQGITFLGGTQETGATDGRSKLYWSPLDKFNPENFPALNVFELPDVAGEIIAFQEAGDFLYAMSRNHIYQLQRMGTHLALGVAHTECGLVSRNAVCPVDNSLMFVTGTQVVLMDPNTGSIQGVSALDRLMADDGMWAKSASSVSCATDPTLGATFLLNSQKEEAVVLWNRSNSITQLEDMNFVFCKSGLEPVSGSAQRAFFITNNCLVVYPDAERNNTKLTMMGVGGTVNGSAGNAPSKIVLTDSTASFASDLKDCYLHMLSGNSAVESKKIVSSTGTTITVSGAGFSNNIVLGDRYSVSPVPYRIRFWPMGNEKEESGYPRYMFRRWVISGMAAFVTGLGGEYTGDNAVLELGMYRDLSAEPVSAATVEVSLDDNPADCYGRINLDGHLMEPSVEQMGSNIDFELLAVDVRVQLTMSRQASDN